MKVFSLKIFVALVFIYLHTIAENVHKTPHRELAEFLVGPHHSYKRLHVVLLYSKVGAAEPICAAVRVPNGLLDTVLDKNGA
jgi:hypothetical protein